MVFKIRIEMDNSAFDSEAGGDRGSEVARILRKLANEIDGDDISDSFGRSLRDVNGNTVGQAEVMGA